MLIPTDLDPPKLVNQLIFSFAILGGCIENESRILINFTMCTEKFNHSLRTLAKCLYKYR